MSDTDFDAVFRMQGEQVTVAPHAAGPWDPGLQHGGAPAALLAWAAEREPTHAPMRLASLTLDLLRPVPVAPLTLHVERTREGRKIQLLSLSLRLNGVEVVRARALKVRTLPEPLTLPELAAAPALELPAWADAEPFEGNARAPSFWSNFEVRHARGGWRTPGPAAVWFKAVRRFVDGAPNSPCMCAAAAADFGNGVSTPLSFDTHTFINGDLSLAFARAPVGDTVLLDAASWLSADGVGLAQGRLADAEGWFARSSQSLVVQAR